MGIFIFRITLLIGFISVNNSPWTDYSAYSFFQIVTMTEEEDEFLHYLIGTILLLIGSIVAASKSYNITGLVAGATFGFLATILCVISMWSSYKVSCITQSTRLKYSCSFGCCDSAGSTDPPDAPNQDALKLED
ncbi:hypothetical protein EK904_005195 [Melospiza melodia maxima]|nr:hypothetical protein EK904_005195 [Melospiza melodia maxima]